MSGSEEKSQLLVAGLTTCDLVYVADELPERGGKATALAHRIDPGGPAANAARIAAALGGDVVLHTVAGTSTLALDMVAQLSASGVQVIDHSDHTDLPVASVWVDAEGERTILSTDNRRSEVSALSGDIDLSEFAGVLLDGHYPDLQRQVATAATAAGIPIVLDCGRWREVFADLLPVATDIIMSESFRPPGMEHTSAHEAVAAISDREGASLCAMTRGSFPIIVETADGMRELEVDQVKPVDTNGAGDVLHGAYLFQRYVVGADSVDALSEAARLATASCRHAGLLPIQEGNDLGSG